MTPIAAPRPTSDTLPTPLRKEVLSVYRSFGGSQADPDLRPGGWDLGCDGFALELDEELHFNRYRAATLDSHLYSRLSAFPLRRYRTFCADYEGQCLKKGRGQGRWMSSPTELQFGPSSPRGSLVHPGPARWKQRALYDFMKDLSSLAGGPVVVRIAIWDTVEQGPIKVTLKRPLVREARSDRR